VGYWLKTCLFSLSVIISCEEIWYDRVALRFCPAYWWGQGWRHFYVCSLSVMCITVVRCHWGPVIPRVRVEDTSTTAFVHWALCVSLRLGAIEAQWFRGSGLKTLLQLRLFIERYVYHCGWMPLRPSDPEGQGWRHVLYVRSLSVLCISVFGCHWGPVIQASVRIGTPGPGRFPYFFEWS
jgi:hypothetical protein